MTPHKGKTVWRNVIVLSYLHVASLYGVYLAITRAKWQTNVFAAFLHMTSCIGITAGAHRLWTHKTYKANFPLRVILMVMSTLAFQGSIFWWCRDHRVHHKFQDTDADPYNARRGLWFSHIGWLLETKHPQVNVKGKSVDVSDLRADSVLMFQEKYIYFLILIICIILPAAIPVFWWDESFTVAWHVVICLRNVTTLNVTWMVNSFAHKYGSRPYDVNLFATENKTVSIFAFGEGWHNYHHAFPWDYKCAELGNYSLNLTTGFIDLFAKLGWAYDLKTVDSEMVKKRVMRTGDGTHEACSWDWGDTDLTEQDKSIAKIDKEVRLKE